MANENSILSTAQQWLWEKARIKSHNTLGDGTSEYGKTPEDLGYKASNLTHMDIGFENGRLMIKAFYTTRKCFYLDIPENQLGDWMRVGLELYRQNPFGHKKNEESNTLSEGW
jgi:hypothetical protein